MAYTFGGTTGTYVGWNQGTTVGVTASNFFVHGWWNASTLTATRSLWGIGGTTGIEVDSTTSELRLRSDNTTDGQWTTTGVGLTVGVPKFIAVYGSFLNTGPAASWLVWVGDMMTQPAAVTVTQAVAPSGNFVGNSSIAIGNKLSASVAFQGDAAHFGCVISDRTSVTDNPFGIAAFGTTTATEAQWIFDRFALPAWGGNLWWMGQGTQAQGINGNGINRWYNALDNGAVPIGHSSQPSVTMPATLVVNVATWSQEGFGRGWQQFAATVL